MSALEQFQESKHKAYAAARKLLPPGMTGDVSNIVNSARLAVIERTLAVLVAAASQHVGSDEDRVLIALREYWEEVTEEIVL